MRALHPGDNARVSRHYINGRVDFSAPAVIGLSALVGPAMAPSAAPCGDGEPQQSSLGQLSPEAEEALGSTSWKQRAVALTECHLWRLDCTRLLPELRRHQPKVLLHLVRQMLRTLGVKASAAGIQGGAGDVPADVGDVAGGGGPGTGEGGVAAAAAAAAAAAEEGRQEVALAGLNGWEATAAALDAPRDRSYPLLSTLVKDLAGSGHEEEAAESSVYDDERAEEEAEEEVARLQRQKGQQEQQQQQPQQQQQQPQEALLQQHHQVAPPPPHGWRPSDFKALVIQRLRQLERDLVEEVAEAQRQEQLATEAAAAVSKGRASPGLLHRVSHWNGTAASSSFYDQGSLRSKLSGVTVLSHESTGGAHLDVPDVWHAD